MNFLEGTIHPSRCPYTIGAVIHEGASCNDLANLNWWIRTMSRFNQRCEKTGYTHREKSNAGLPSTRDDLVPQVLWPQLQTCSILVSRQNALHTDWQVSKSPKCEPGENMFKHLSALRICFCWRQNEIVVVLDPIWADFYWPWHWPFRISVFWSDNAYAANHASDGQRHQCRCDLVDLPCEWAESGISRLRE